MTKDYPLFAPPLEFAHKPPEDWTFGEAHAYLEWLLGEVDIRTDGLIDYLDVERAGDHVRLLSQAGLKAAAVLKEPAFSRHTEGPSTISLKGHSIEYDLGPTLTPSGQALAADLGLLLARYLVMDFPDAVHWVVGRGPRRYVWQNRPVLVGSGFDAFDPIGVAIANAHGLLRGERDGGVWAAMYERCAMPLASENRKPRG